MHDIRITLILWYTLQSTIGDRSLFNTPNHPCISSTHHIIHASYAFRLGKWKPSQEKLQKVHAICHFCLLHKITCRSLSFIKESISSNNCSDLSCCVTSSDLRSLKNGKSNETTRWWSPDSDNRYTSSNDWHLRTESNWTLMRPEQQTSTACITYNMLLTSGSQWAASNNKKHGDFKHVLFSYKQSTKFPRYN
jgi:hypothetical protein